MHSSTLLPPLEFCLGANPIQAASWRALSKLFASPTVAANALAVSGPMAGTFSSLRLIALLVPDLDSRFEFADLTVQFLEMSQQAIDQQPQRAWQLVARVLDQPGNAFDLP